ncbi:unnamed protein product [Closterium sp. Naga37s-1]|nr:unnamed protein product [Closterium sp. Naga37s-1]
MSPPPPRPPAGFLPAFERIGRVCHVYLTPSDVFLLHNVLSADGVQAIAQFPTVRRAGHRAVPHCSFPPPVVHLRPLSLSLPPPLPPELFSEHLISSGCVDHIPFSLNLSLLALALPLSSFPSLHSLFSSSHTFPPPPPLPSCPIQGELFWKHAELFSEHLISSASADRIAFSLDLSLLARALRSSLATAATRHQLKLVKKSTNPTAPALPFLSLEAKGERSSIVQDIPISTPLPRSQLNELQAGIDLVHSLPETLVQLPDLPSLRHLVERLQSVGDVADVATMRSGALAMRTHTPSITVAAQFKNLKVFGANSVHTSPSVSVKHSLARCHLTPCHPGHIPLSPISPLPHPPHASTPEQSVSVKHLARSLQCYLTRPDASYCGVAPNEACLLMIFPSDTLTRCCMLLSPPCNQAECHHPLTHLPLPPCMSAGVAPNEACLLMIFQYAASPISLQYRLPLLDPG